VQLSLMDQETRGQWHASPRCKRGLASFEHVHGSDQEQLCPFVRSLADTDVKSTGALRLVRGLSASSNR